MTVAPDTYLKAVHISALVVWCAGLLVFFRFLLFRDDDADLMLKDQLSAVPADGPHEQKFESRLW